VLEAIHRKQPEVARKAMQSMIEDSLANLHKKRKGGSKKAS